MKKRDLLPDGGERKEKPCVEVGTDLQGYSRFVCIEIEHYDKPQKVKKTKRTTLEMFDNTPLAKGFKENRIIGVL